MNIRFRKNGSNKRIRATRKSGTNVGDPNHGRGTKGKGK